MKKNKFSKEAFWAFSIILICILAGCALLFKMSTTESEAISRFTNKEMMVLNNRFPESVVAPTDSPHSTAISVETNEEANALSEEVSNAESPETLTDSTLPHYDCPIDFASLWDINEDVYAWITIPGTIIDYPILQHKTDDSYYLNYNIDGTEGFPGCIYTEKATATDFSDNNTVIYGHNLKDGQMFTQLHKFRDPDFFSDNDTIYIYTPEKEFTYKIFAVYIYDNRHLLNSFDFSDKNVYKKYLSEIQNLASESGNLRKEIKITDTDKIITLITCTRNNPEKRVYVQAVLQP